LSYYYILYNESKHDNIQTKQLFACLAIIVVVLGGPPPSPLKERKGSKLPWLAAKGKGVMKK
jgi:hypothetical protein